MDRVFPEESPNRVTDAGASPTFRDDAENSANLALGVSRGDMFCCDAWRPISGEWRLDSRGDERGEAARMEDDFKIWKIFFHFWV